MRCCWGRPRAVRAPQKKSSEAATVTRVPSQKREEGFDSREGAAAQTQSPNRGPDGLCGDRDAEEEAGASPFPESVSARVPPLDQRPQSDVATLSPEQPKAGELPAAAPPDSETSGFVECACSSVPVRALTSASVPSVCPPELHAAGAASSFSPVSAGEAEQSQTPTHAQTRSDSFPCSPSSGAANGGGAGDGDGTSEFHSAVETPPAPTLSPATPVRLPLPAEAQPSCSSPKQPLRVALPQPPAPPAPPAPPPAVSVGQLPAQLWQRLLNCFSSPSPAGASIATLRAASGGGQSGREGTTTTTAVKEGGTGGSGSPRLLFATQTSQSLAHAPTSASRSGTRLELSPAAPSSERGGSSSLPCASVPASTSAVCGSSERKSGDDSEELGQGSLSPPEGTSEARSAVAAARQRRQHLHRDNDGASSLLSLQPTAADASSPPGSSGDSLADSAANGAGAEDGVDRIHLAVAEPPKAAAHSNLATSRGGAGASDSTANEPPGHAASTLGFGRRSSAGVKPSLENSIARMQKHLFGLIEEELLFKAFAFLQFVEQRLESARLELQSQRSQMALRSGESAAACEEEGRLIDEKEQLLARFQEVLGADIRIANLRVKIGMIGTFFDLFHLEQLRAVCEEARISFTQSLSQHLSPFPPLVQAASAAVSVHGCSSASAVVQRTSSSAVAGSGLVFSEKGNGGMLRSSAGGTQSQSLCAASADGLPFGGGVDCKETSVGGGTLPERKTSTTRLKIGLRSVGRKMSLTRRSSLTPRRSSVKKVIAFKNNTDEEGWIRERGKYLDLSYRVEKDSAVSIKVRGKLPCPLFQVLAVLNESDLAGNWAPMFKCAERVHAYSRASQLIKQVFDYPVLGAKETVMYTFGVNALEECGAVIIFCTSPPEGATEFMGRPVPPRDKVPRMQSANMLWFLYPISEGRQTTMELFASFQHGVKFVPTRMVTFIIKKVIRGTFVSIAKHCQHFDASPYKERVARNPEFYTWMRDCIDDYVLGESAAPIKQVESLSLCSFDYEKFQE